MQNYDPDALRDGYRALQSGEPRMRAIREAITAAELAHDDSAALQFHADLIRESVFSGDRLQALVDFPQYLAVTERDPALAKENLWDTLWMFKWIVEAATEFYQIEKVQILRWFSEFRRMLTVNGYSLRTWYEKRAIFYQYADRAKMRLDYEDFLHAPKDEMGDGEASELDSVVRCESYAGRDFYPSETYTKENPRFLWGFRDKDFLLAHGANTLIASPSDLVNLLTC